MISILEVSQGWINKKRDKLEAMKSDVEKQRKGRNVFELKGLNQDRKIIKGLDEKILRSRKLASAAKMRDDIRYAERNNKDLIDKENAHPIKEKLKNLVWRKVNKSVKDQKKIENTKKIEDNQFNRAKMPVKSENYKAASEYINKKNTPEKIKPEKTEVPRSTPYTPKPAREITFNKPGSSSFGWGITRPAQKSK